MALPAGTEVVSGGAPGVDRTAITAAKRRYLSATVFLAEWGKYGKQAGPMHNQQIVDYCDRVVAFWDGTSSGTADTIRRARAAGKPVEVMTP